MAFSQHSRRFKCAHNMMSNATPLSGLHLNSLLYNNMLRNSKQSSMFGCSLLLRRATRPQERTKFDQGKNNAVRHAQACMHVFRPIYLAHLRAEREIHPSQLGQPVSAARGGVQHVGHAHVCTALEQLGKKQPDIVDKKQAQRAGGLSTS